MIEIKLKEDNYLTSDRKNWIFGKKVFQKNLDREVIRGEYFFQDVNSAVEKIFEEYIRTEDAETLKELVEKVDKAKKEILEAIKNIK